MKTKCVLLTGASSGIGRAIGIQLLEDGYRVWGTSRNPSRLPVHDNFHPLRMDLQDMQSVRSAAARALEESGGFHVLINNAASTIYAPLECLSTDEIRDQFQLLVLAPIELAKLLLPGMRIRGEGVIVNISSLAGVFPIPYMGAYNAAKAALSSLSWTLAMELCREPIRIVDLRPGDIRTEFHHTMERHASLEAASPGDNIALAYQAYTDNMNRAPPPERVALAVSSLLSRDKKSSSRLNVGGVFQARIAPLLSNLGPWSWTSFVLKKYYGLKCRSS